METHTMLKRIFALLLFVLSAHVAFAQQASDKKPAETEKLRKEAVEFLRETMTEVNNMRSLENRISFASEMASLMWLYDEREARSMYVGVAADFKSLVIDYDNRMNALGPSEDDDLGYAGPFSGDMSEGTRLKRQFTVALGVRKQIALTLAEHEPDMAINFYRDSVQAVNNKTLRKQIAGPDNSFEFELMGQIAENSAAKAAAMAKKSLDKGVTYQHLDLLKKIYEKDADKGIDLASDMLSKIKDDRGSKLADLSVMTSLLRYGTETFEKSKKEGAKKPVYDESQLRDLADTIGQIVLDAKVNGDDPGAIEIADVIEKYAPSRALQIRAKFRPRSPAANSPSQSSGTMNTTGYASNSNAAGLAAAQRRASADAADKKLLEDVQKVGNSTLPKEEREKVITELRKIISQTKGTDKKIIALNMLASQVFHAGDKDLAGDIMKDAEGLVNPQPKNFQDFLFTWMVVSGYAEVNPEKAFPIIENAILRLNDTIGAFLKVAEFIDLNGEIIDDGEIQVGAFGGSMLREITGMLNSGGNVVGTLAHADFAKTKALTNDFERPEVRVLAKMMVIRTILAEKKDADAAKAALLDK